MLAHLDDANVTPLEMLTLHDIPDAVESIATGEIPGFQLIPGTEPAIAKIALTRAMKAYVPEFVFNAFTEVIEADARDSGPHIDLGVEGIALHVNRKGAGTVYLASLAASTYSCSAGGVVTDQNNVGSTHTGALSDGMLTVFSEGFTAHNEAEIGHAFHQFVSAEGNFTRWWSRHAFAPSSLPIT